MSSRFQLYSICTILSIGSLFASDFSELGNEYNQMNGGEIAAHTPSKNGNMQSNGKGAAPAPHPTLILQPCPDTWRLSADFLYLLPTVDDTYYVVTSPAGTSDSTVIGTRKNNDFGFTPAFRVGAEYAFCDTGRDIQAFYTYMHNTQNHTTSGDNLWATVGSTDMSSGYENYEGTASSKLKLLYQRFDFNVSQHALNMHGLHFYLQPGLEYAYLRLQERYNYQITGGDLGTTKRQSRTWGVGPQLGLGLDCNLYEMTSCSNQWSHSFAFSTLFSTSILMGQSQTKQYDNDAGSIDVDTKDEYTWRTVPALHARAALSYLVHGSCYGMSLSIGYEFSDYIRGMARTLHPSTSALSNTATDYYNFDVQGLDINLAFTF